MKIRRVVCHTAPMAGSWLSESVIANPMSGYPEYHAKRSSWFGPMTAAVIEVVLEDGTRGSSGPVSKGDDAPVRDVRNP